MALRAARTCLALRAHAGEGGHAVDAGGPRRAGGEGAVVDVLAAVVAAPAVDAHAAVAPVAVGARAPVLTGVGLQQALVHVLRAELAFGGGGREAPLIRVGATPAPARSAPSRDPPGGRAGGRRSEGPGVTRASGPP